MTEAIISQQNWQDLVEKLLSAIANQKFIHKLDPWKREEAQTAIDLVFNEGMEALSKSRKEGA